MKGLVIAALLSLGLGCESASVPPAVVVRTVTGSQRVSYATVSGMVEVPVDLSTYQISALVQTADNQIREFAGAGRPDGTFRIPSVPEGPYLLRVQPALNRSQPAPTLLITTTEDRVDLGYDLPGRADKILPTLTPTNLAVSASQLSPWIQGDDLQLVVPNLGWIGSLSNGSLLLSDGAPRNGDSSISNLTIDFSHADHQSPIPLIDEVKGDVAWLAQLVLTEIGGGESYATLSRLWMMPHFRIENGKQTALNGSFIEVKQDQPLHLRWSRTAFATLASQIMGRPAIDQSVRLALAAHPPGTVAVRPDILRYSPPVAVADVELQLKTGNGYPPDWPLVLTMEQRISSNFYPHDTFRPFVIEGSLLVQLPLSNQADLALQPSIGPVLEVRFNGRDSEFYLGPRDGAVSVTWRASEVGTATGFVVDVFDLASDYDGNAKLTQLLRCYTTQTRILLPAGVLPDSSFYILRITAYNMPGVDFSKSPLRRVLPQSSADKVVTWQQY